MGQHIEIPFMDEWRVPMLSGQKICTSRTKRCGKLGDTFKCWGSTFKIIAVQKMPLSVVGEYLYLLEGCTAPRHFELVWGELHPRHGWEPSLLVWVHFFQINSLALEGRSATS